MNKSLGICIILLGLSGCTHAAKYDDVKQAINAIVTAQHRFTEQLENVKDAATLANAINAYATSLENFTEVIQALSKHTELHQQIVPPELKEAMSNFNAVLEDVPAMFTAAQNAVTRYNTSPSVLKADQHLKRTAAAMHDRLIRLRDREKQAYELKRTGRQ